jgi:hypothetical protein
MFQTVSSLSLEYACQTCVNARRESSSHAVGNVGNKVMSASFTATPAPVQACQSSPHAKHWHYNAQSCLSRHPCLFEMIVSYSQTGTTCSHLYVPSMPLSGTPSRGCISYAALPSHLYAVAERTVMSTTNSNACYKL